MTESNCRVMLYVVNVLWFPAKHVHILYCYAHFLSKENDTMTHIMIYEIIPKSEDCARLGEE